MGKNYWMVVQTLENFRITRDMGFTMHGVGSKYRRRAQRMQPDDRMLFYVRDLRKWPAVASITSKSFTDRTPIWKPSRRGEDFQHRVKIRPNFVLEEDDYIDGLILGPRLEYVKRWPPERWPLAFHDSLHLLSQRDFRLIEGEIKRIVKKAARKGDRYPEGRGPEQDAADSDLGDEPAAAGEDDQPRAPDETR